MRARTLIVALVALAFVGACAEEVTQPSAPSPGGAATEKAAKKKAKDEKKDADAAEGEVEIEYSYSPVGKRDPFRPYLDSRPTKEKQIDPSCGPLCSWDIEQLRVVAVVSGMATPLAMVEAPGGRGYVIRRGSPIGQQGGRVTEILRDRVLVTEMLSVGSGQYVPTVTELPLRGLKKEETDALENLMAGEE